MRGRSTVWRFFNSSSSAARPVAVIGTFSTIFPVLQTVRSIEGPHATIVDSAFGHWARVRKPTSSFGPFRGRHNVTTSGEFQPNGWFSNRLAGASTPGRDQLSEK